MTGMSDRAAQRAGAAKSALILLSVSAALVAGAPRYADAGNPPAAVLIVEGPPAPEAGAPTEADGPVAHVEARISKLQKELHITAEQEPQFKAFAEVMRSNAQAMHTLFQQRGQSTDNTAVADLHWYAQLTAAHAEAVNKLIPVFDALYASLSEKQKEKADKVFDEFRVRRPPHRTG
jgi:hypothetical protein